MSKRLGVRALLALPVLDVLDVDDNSNFPGLPEGLKPNPRYEPDIISEEICQDNHWHRGIMPGRDSQRTNTITSEDWTFLHEGYLVLRTQPWRN